MPTNVDALREAMNRIASIREDIKNKKWQLDKVLAHIKKDVGWTVWLKIDDDLPYGYREVSYRVSRDLLTTQIIGDLQNLNRDLVVAEAEFEQQRRQ